jgi:protein disulfide-isomerase-like protein
VTHDFHEIGIILAVIIIIIIIMTNSQEEGQASVSQPSLSMRRPSTVKNRQRRRSKQRSYLAVLSTLALSCCVLLTLGVGSKNNDVFFGGVHAVEHTTATTAAASSSTTIPLEVIELTSQNFASHVGDGNVWLIEFYTPWCSHCTTFKPAYDSIALTFHSSPQEKIRVAKVDCSVEKALMTRFGVNAFPTFFIVSGYDVYEYDGVRNEPNLITFARGGYKKQDVSGCV